METGKLLLFFGFFAVIVLNYVNQPVLRLLGLGAIAAFFVTMIYEEWIKELRDPPNAVTKCRSCGSVFMNRFWSFAEPSDREKAEPTDREKKKLERKVDESRKRKTSLWRQLDVDEQTSLLASLRLSEIPNLLLSLPDYERHWALNRITPRTLKSEEGDWLSREWTNLKRDAKEIVWRRLEPSDKRSCLRRELSKELQSNAASDFLIDVEVAAHLLDTEHLGAESELLNRLNETWRSIDLAGQSVIWSLLTRSGRQRILEPLWKVLNDDDRIVLWESLTEHDREDLWDSLNDHTRFFFWNALGEEGRRRAWGHDWDKPQRERQTRFWNHMTNDERMLLLLSLEPRSRLKVLCSSTVTSDNLSAMGSENLTSLWDSFELSAKSELLSRVTPENRTALWAGVTQDARDEFWKCLTAEDLKALFDNLQMNDTFRMHPYRPVPVRHQPSSEDQWIGAGWFLSNIPVERLIDLGRLDRWFDGYGRSRILNGLDDLTLHAIWMELGSDERDSLWQHKLTHQKRTELLARLDSSAKKELMALFSPTTQLEMLLWHDDMLKWWLNLSNRAQEQFWVAFRSHVNYSLMHHVTHRNWPRSTGSDANYVVSYWTSIVDPKEKEAVWEKWSVSERLYFILCMRPDLLKDISTKLRDVSKSDEERFPYNKLAIGAYKAYFI